MLNISDRAYISKDGITLGACQFFKSWSSDNIVKKLSASVVDSVSTLS